MREKIARTVIAIAVAAVVSGRVCEGVDTVTFSSSDVGTIHAVGEWTDDFGDLRVSGATMGSSLTSYGTDFNMGLPLNADGTLSAAQKTWINNQAATIRASGLNLNIFMGPTVGNTDASYLNAASGNIIVTQWAAAVTAYKDYWQSLGFTVTDVTPFNEPDYWSGQGSPAQLAQVMQLLRDDPSWKGTKLQGAATLDSDNAQTWYTPLEGIADAGSSHLLGGSLTSYNTFAQSVAASGSQYAAPELHSLAEAIVSANYNASQAGWWSTTDLARGTFSQVSSGKRLGYSVDFNSQTSAAVYRGTDGSTYAFAGGLERFGGASTYRFVSTDRPMYVNGIGPIKSYTMQADSDADTAVSSNTAVSFGSYFDQGAMAKIDYGAASMPALDGYRWKIQNVSTGQYLNVSAGSTSNFALINTASGSTSASQMWDITRVQDGYLELINTNSGRVVDMNGGTQSAGGSAIQYDYNGNLNQQWDLVPASNGTFYIQDGNSALYLTGSSTNCTQQNLASGSGAALQQWRFVSANPTRVAKASYAFNGNANDTAGTYNGTITGTATYTAGPTAGSQALVLNGSSTYVTLPSAVSSTSAGIITNYSSGFTVDTWVKWNGGNAWQRIFDFGTGTGAYMFLTPSSGDGTLRFGITSAGTAEEEDVDANALQTGQWVNVAVTLGGHSAIIYVNGQPVAAGSMLINPTWVNATNDYIGKSQFSADPLFNGSISQFSVYDYALTPTQVADLLNNNLIWTGAQNGNTWDAATTANFNLVNTGAAKTYSQGDRVTFAGTGTSTVNLSGVLSPFSVTVSSNSAVTFAGTGSIAGSAALTKTGSGTLTVNTTNTFTGGTAISGGNVVMANASALGTGGIDLVTGGTLTTTNYSSGSPSISNTIYGDGGTVSAASGTTLTLSGNLAGSGPLTLTAADSTAALRLIGNNSTFAGNAIVSGANVRLASANAGSGSATWTINTALQLDVAGATTYQLGALAGSGVVAGHAVNSTSTTSTLTIGGAGASTVFSGQIADNAGGGVNNVVGLMIAGTGTQILSGTNTYTGPTLISSGTLMLGNGGTTGSINLASALTDNGTLAFNHSNSLTEGVNFNPITGTGGLLQAGTGTLVLNSNNNYSGGTTITAGVVSISDDTNIGANGSPITLNGGTLTTTAGVFDTHPFTIGTAGGTINVQTTGQYFFNINNLLRGNGALTLTGNGTLTANVGNLRLNQGNTFSGAVLLQQGGILEYGQNGAISSSAAVTIANQGELAVQGGFAVTEPSAITVTGNTNSVLSFENGTAGNVSGGITINGALTIGLRNWYNYATVEGGTISGVISGAGGITVNSGTGAGGTLKLSGLNTFTGNITINNAILAAGTLINGTPASQIPSNLGDLAVSGRTITINSGGVLSLTSGNVLGTGTSTNTLSGLTLVVNSGGVFQTGLNGSGTGWWNKIGNLNLNGGTVHVGSGANSTNFQGLALIGTVTVGGTASSTIDNFAAASFTTDGVHLGQNSAAGQSINFNVADVTGNANPDLIISAELLNTSANLVASGLTKNGAGTIQLNGANSYTGTTTVNAGVLAINGSISSPVTVSSGSLQGAGTITGNVNISSGATLSPGNASNTVNTPGALTINGSTTLNNGSTLNFNLGGESPTQFSQLHVNGQLTAGASSTLSVSLVNGFQPLVGDSFDIVNWNTLSGSLNGPTSSFNGRVLWNTSLLNTTGVISAASTFYAGDFNRNSHVDASDFLPMMQALADPSDYEATHGNMTDAQLNLIGDINGDGTFNNADVQALIISLQSGGGSTSGVPEPTSVVLLALGAVGLALLRTGRSPSRRITQR